jgi:hypothetical protein
MDANYAWLWKVFGGRYLLQGDLAQFIYRSDKNLHGLYPGQLATKPDSFRTQVQKVNANFLGLTPALLNLTTMF